MSMVANFRRFITKSQIYDLLILLGLTARCQSSLANSVKQLLAP